MTSEEIKNLIGQPESETLEYKTSVPLPQVIARVIAAFANTSGGVLILGVGDDLKVVGLEEDSPVGSVVEAAISRIAPQPKIRHYQIDLNQDSETKRLYVIEVEKCSSLVVTENASVYIRKGGATTKQNIPQVVPIPVQPKNDCIIQLSNNINNIFNGSTESKTRLLKQYLDLLKLSNDLIDAICPADPQRPTNIQYGRTVARLIFSSVVDSFETYLVSLLAEIHLARPETLKSDSTLTTKEILGCQDMSEIIELAARKRVEKITRGNEEEFTKAFKPTGIEPLLENEIPVASDWFQIRHLFTHKNGIVDRKFLAKVPKTRLNPGDEYAVSLEGICRSINFFINVVYRIDAEAIAKHGLSTN